MATPWARKQSSLSVSTSTCAPAASATASISCPTRSPWTEAPETFSGLARQRQRWRRGLADPCGRHRRIIGKSALRRIGLLAMPYFVVFELLGRSLTCWATSRSPWRLRFQLLFGGLFPRSPSNGIERSASVFLSFAALALEEFSFRRHPRGREVVRLLAYAVFENLGYRQLTSIGASRPRRSCPRGWSGAS